MVNCCSFRRFTLSYHNWEMSLIMFCKSLVVIIVLFRRWNKFCNELLWECMRVQGTVSHKWWVSWSMYVIVGMNKIQVAFIPVLYCVDYVSNECVCVNVICCWYLSILQWNVWMLASVDSLCNLTPHQWHKKKWCLCFSSHIEWYVL